MTQYEYVCESCGDEMEVSAPMGTAEHSLPCSSCGGRSRIRVSSPLFLRGTANAEEAWNPSLGIAHRTDAQAQEYVREHNDTHDDQITLDL